MGDVPGIDTNPALTYRTALIPARRDLARWNGKDINEQHLAPLANASSVEISEALLSQIQSRIPDTQLIDLKSRFCTGQNLCSYMEGDKLLFSDNNHVAPAGAQYALQSFHLPRL
jgi:hypothetical protein